MSHIMSIHSLLGQHRIRQSRVLIVICLRVHSAAQVEVTSVSCSHSQTEVGPVHAPAIRQDMRQCTFGPKFAVSLVSHPSVSTSNRFPGQTSVPL